MTAYRSFIKMLKRIGPLWHALRECHPVAGFASDPNSLLLVSAIIKDLVKGESVLTIVTCVTEAL